MYENIKTDGHTLGADLRALRKARGLTLADMAQELNRSVGWVSQIERDKSEPSINDLRAIAKLLDVSVSSLFHSGSSPIEEQGYVVRNGARRPIGSRETGLVEELLSPDLTDDFEMVHSTFEPGVTQKEFITRPTQEVGYIVSGSLEMWIGEQAFELRAGDSFRIRGEPHRWRNASDTPCVAIWVIAPPIY